MAQTHVSHKRFGSSQKFQVKVKTPFSDEADFIGFFVAKYTYWKLKKWIA
jgi:hypothetical protein